MKTSARAIAIVIAIGASCAPFGASAFVSGSTGADGAFSPTVNTTVDLPPSGIFNYTSVNIPAGVTVKFRRNTTNTPVVILATGDVTIAGTLHLSGDPGKATGAAGDGATGDDGAPGVGGPGGFDGGRGGPAGVAGSLATRGGNGLGPGAGGGAVFAATVPGGFNNTSCGGGGGTFGAVGADGGNSDCRNRAGPTNSSEFGVGGSVYGSSVLLPLIGGSGGGGGAGGLSFIGSGGGGGGGAIVIAASGTVNVTGSLLANGGAGGAASGSGSGGGGGGGSGGGIRIIATTISGNGTISAAAGALGTSSLTTLHNSGAGGVGRVRLEAETFTRTAASIPIHSFAQPGAVFVAGTPTLAISSVAGVKAPAAPTGNADITLPATTPNPVTVVFTTAGVPVGNTVQLTVTPANAAPTVVVSPALTGTTASATASVSVNLPVGPSVLSAQTTFTVVAALGDLLKNFAGNERVERIRLVATFGGQTEAKLITVSGKEYDAPAEALRIAAMGG